MMPQPGKQIIAIKILPNAARSKDNQTMKIGQLIEYSMRNIFLQKFYAKFDLESTPRPCSKKLKLRISLDQ